MPSKTDWFSKLCSVLMPFLYGLLVTSAALGVLVLTVLFTAHDKKGLEGIQKMQSRLLSRLPGPDTPHEIARAAPMAPKPSWVLPEKKTSEKPKPQEPQLQQPPVAQIIKPVIKPWTWTPLVDEVSEFFRTSMPDLGGLPLLAYATMLDDAEWVTQLIARGADVNERTPAGDTLLCLAVRVGAAGSARELLFGGADWKQTGLEKQLPLPLASLRRGADLYRALLAAGADPDTRFSYPVAKQVLDRVTIRDLKNSLESDRGVTPLMACAARGDVEGAAELMRWGASAGKCTTRYHRYPIHFAAAQGYLFLMRIILGRNPDSEPRVLVTVDLTNQRAWVTLEGQVIDSCRVSTGRSGYATPAGRYVITDKHRSWTSTLYHVAMPYFMRLNCSAIGLHSGYVTGRPASHGCIRLPYEKAREFFAICKVGDEVQIVH